jgi:hypothetical protein
MLLHCWIIWKVAFLAPPSHIWAPHSGNSFGCLVFQLATLHVGESPNLGATQGVAWVALSRAFPQTQGISFCLVLLHYMTSGPFSWCYILLLTQRFFWYYFSRTVMAILCCVAQKAASAAHSEPLNILLGPFQIFLKIHVCWRVERLTACNQLLVRQGLDLLLSNWA